MYRVSPFVRHFARALLSGAVVASVWVNLAPETYYDAVEFRLADFALPFGGLEVSLTPMRIVSDGLMALFMAFVGKELWEALVLQQGALTGRLRARLPLWGVLGGMIGAVLVWTLAALVLETSDEAGFATGWPVPLGSDVVLAYMFGRWVFGPGHAALHLLLLITIGQDIAGLLVLGLAYPEADLRLAWLLLPALAVGLVWALRARHAHPGAPERARRRAMALWPYALAGLVSWLGVALAGLPPALGLLPVIPVMPHADRSFGLFAEAEEFLHDPLNRMAHLLVLPLTLVLFLFGLTRGGIELQAYAPTTEVLLCALWLGKPLGMVAGFALALGPGRAPRPPGTRDLWLVALLSGVAFTVPVLALDRALPGGLMAEAARLGLGLSLLAGLLALLLSRITR